MANSKKLSQWLRNPFTGEEIEITATTESALNNKCEKQSKIWEKDQAEWERQKYATEQYQNVQQMDEENRQLIHNLRHRMLSYIVRWPSYRYYDGLKRKRRYSDISAPPTLKEVKKDIKVPWKIGALEFFSEERKKRRVAVEKKAQQELEKRQQEYSNCAAAYEKKNAEYNVAIDRKNEAFASGEPQEVTEFFAWVIEQDCSYIEGYYVGVQTKENIFYNPEKRMLAVDLKLPATRRIPDIESYEYEEKEDNIKAKRMAQSDFKSFYGHIVCDIVLRVICVLFESDEYRLVDSIVVNGYRVFLDRSRGKYINDCIISVEFSRKEFNELYLRNADGEAVIKRVSKSVPSDFTVEPIHLKPIYDSGILNVFYVK